jgi:hypothetical protein
MNWARNTLAAPMSPPIANRHLLKIALFAQVCQDRHQFSGDHLCGKDPIIYVVIGTIRV